MSGACSPNDDDDNDDDDDDGGGSVGDDDDDYGRLILRGHASRWSRDAYPRGIARPRFRPSDSLPMAMRWASDGLPMAFRWPSDAPPMAFQWPSDPLVNRPWRFRVGTRPVADGTHTHAESPAGAAEARQRRG